MQTITSIPTIATKHGELPVFVFPADHELPVAEQVEVGQIIAFHSRGRYRAAKVTKVTAKRVTAEYTTQGAYDEAVKIASIDRVAFEERRFAHDEKTKARYLAWAELIEAGTVQPTDGFVPIASLPAEAQALEAQSGSRNGARTTIVWPAEKYRGWAGSSDEAMAAHEARLAAAREEMARPVEERIIEATHVTTKNVKRCEVFAVEGGC